LRNPAYTGQARSGINTLEDAHPAIITRAEYDAAQHRRGVSPLRSPDGALLAGLLRCSGCRYVMKLDSIRDRDGSKLPMYRCRGDHAAGRCPNMSSVLAHIIEGHVEAEFLAALGPGGVLARPGTTDGTDAALYTTVDDAEADMADWLEAVSPSSVGRAAYANALEVRQHRVDAARQALSAAQAAESVHLPPQADLQAVWPTLSTPERRRLLSAGIDTVFLRRGRDITTRSLILFAGDGPTDLPSRGRRVPLAGYTWPDAPDDTGVAVA
jgi:hypothetical protein